MTLKTNSVTATTKALLLIFLAIALNTKLITAQESITFPAKNWENITPKEAGVNSEKLNAFIQKYSVRGYGMLIKDGKVLGSWGQQDKVYDWYSGSKPLLSIFLFHALQENKISTVDTPVKDLNFEMRGKDKGIALFHLANMVSGYTRKEGPGIAWAYNDYGMQLLQLCIFNRIFKVDNGTELFKKIHKPLNFQDDIYFTPEHRLYASIRDYARLILLWSQKGKWQDQQILEKKYFDEFVKPQTPTDLKRSRGRPRPDYLGIGSYGGKSSHYMFEGAGIYGFGWWFNRKGGSHPNELTFPDLPEDLFISIGVLGRMSAILPSQNLILITADADFYNIKPGKREGNLYPMLAEFAKLTEK